MASSKLSPCLIFVQIIFLVFNLANAQLRVGFYKDTCPKAEAIVKEVMHQVMKVAPSLSGPLLRMHFHDCFVRGLSVKDLVVLSGGHTIGTSHCSSFSSRLYNSTGKNGTDPTLDSEYIEKLKSRCKSDAALLDNMETKAYIKLQSAATHRSTFFKDFGVSMVNMGRVGVLTGKAGEIRKVCSKVN
ncbi:hypothetical protein D5086_033457 [Populus alba]|uniref:Uncharacterized protein n=1 Tax=Populus alba TaxID=43335 RepID=A0ACC4AGV2_POPAL